MFKALIFKVCLWSLIFHILKFKNMCKRNKNMLMPNVCLYSIFVLNLNSCCCRWIYFEAWKKCLQYACFYLCNFINLDNVGHWPNSTQHVHLCMCVVGCMCIYLCLMLKLNVFAWICYGHWITQLKYRWFLYFFLGD